ncbi:putative acetyltransferase [Bacillus sp. TS-2]|nr:putative acetyltransferase [Bacillus sp. TS-2]
MSNYFPFFYQLPTLQTERMTLRKVNKADLDSFIEATLSLQSEKTKVVEDDCTRFINHLLKCYDKGRPAPWGVIESKSNRLIGVCGFVHWSPLQASAELGYHLVESYWNAGIMTEVLKCLIDYSFMELGLKSIEAKCQIKNIASKRVLNKVGMKKSGTYSTYVWSSSKYEHLEYFRLDQSEYMRRVWRNPQQIKVMRK